MSTNWQSVRLGEVLARSDDWVQVDPVEEYKEVTVRLWGRGVALRRVVSGSEIAGNRRLRVHPGQFIVSRIDARNGAFGLIPEELDGAVVTNDFPVFIPDESRLLPAYLGWLSRTRTFVDACRSASEGTTNRVRLKEDRFYRLSIPLPPVPEQRRIVAKIESLAARIAEAGHLRKHSALAAEALRHSYSRAAFEDGGASERVCLEDVCSGVIDCLHSNPVYAESGTPTVRSPDVGWGKLLLDTARKTDEDEYQRRTRRGEPQPGDIILVREGGGTGKAGIVEKGQRLSLGQRVMQLRPNRRKVAPRFLLYQWLSPLVQHDQIAERMKGSASPHLNIRAIRRFQLVLPPLGEQHRVVEYLDGLQGKLDRLKELQAKTTTTLDALLPSILDKAFKGEL